jgi:hypothetical protein
VTRLASVDVTTLTTNVPSGDDETGRRLAKLATRDEDLRAHGHHGYRVCTTVVIPNGDSVMIVDTLEREENQQ